LELVKLDKDCETWK